MRSPPALLTVLIGCINLCPRALGKPLNHISSPTFSPSHQTTLRPSSKLSSRPSAAPSLLSLSTQTSFLRTADNSVDSDQKSTPKIVYFVGLIMCFGFGLIYFVHKSMSRNESGGGDNDAEAIVAEILQDIEMPNIAVASDPGPTRDNKKGKDDSSDSKRSRRSDVSKQSRRSGDSKRRRRSDGNRSQRKPSHSDDISEVDDDDADDEGLDERRSKGDRKNSRLRKDASDDVSDVDDDTDEDEFEENGNWWWWRKSGPKNSRHRKDYEDDDTEHNEESTSWSDVEIEEDVVSVDYSSSSSESFDPLEDDVESAACSASLIRKFGGEITVPNTKTDDTSVAGSVSTASKFGELSAITTSFSQADSFVSEEVETVWSDESLLSENQNRRGSKRRANKPSQRHRLSTVLSVSSNEGEVSLYDTAMSMSADEAATLSLQDTTSHSLASM